MSAQDIRHEVGAFLARLLSMKTGLTWAVLALAVMPFATEAQDDNPFTNEGGLAGPEQEAPRARLKPDHIRVQITKEDCRRVVAHQPSADVAYQPGVDVYGNEVAPADLEGSNDLAKKLLDKEIAFDLELNPLLFAGNTNLETWFENSTVNFGRIVYDKETGRMTLDGELLNDPQQAAIAEACRRLLNQ